MFSHIQKEIESVYQISCPQLIDDFLMDAPTQHQYSQKIPWLMNTREALVIDQQGEDLHVGLWFDPRLLVWAKNQEWKILLKNLSTSPHFEKVGALLEGVSHFVYLLWRAQQNHPVTQLELELQAEIDKFVLMSHQKDYSTQHRISHHLFETNRWRGDLTPETRERYETASKLASKYCHYLRREYLLQNRREELKREICSFYRLPQADKIRHINQ